jgi:hypothetical protein
MRTDELAEVVSAIAEVITMQAVSGSVEGSRSLGGVNTKALQLAHTLLTSRMHNAECARLRVAGGRTVPAWRHDDRIRAAQLQRNRECQCKPGARTAGERAAKRCWLTHN